MKKSKLIATLCTLVLTLACLTFGVYSAVKTTFTASGTITFNAYSLDIDVKCTISGLKDGATKTLYGTTFLNSANVNNSTRTNYVSSSAILADDTHFNLSASGATMNLGELAFDELSGDRNGIQIKFEFWNYSNYVVKAEAVATVGAEDKLIYSPGGAAILNKYTATETDASVDSDYGWFPIMIYTEDDATAISSSENSISIAITVSPDGLSTKTESGALKLYDSSVIKTASTDVTFDGLIYDLKNLDVKSGIYYGSTDEGPVARSPIFKETLNLATSVLGKNITKVGGIGAEANSLGGFDSIKRLALPWGITGGNCTGVLCGLSELQDLIIPENVKTLGGYTIISCGISEVYIAGDLLGIETYCFSQCNSLSKIYLPSSITFIDYNAFYGCSDNLFQIKNGAKYLYTVAGEAILYDITDKNATSYTLDSSIEVKFVSGNIFYEYSDSSVTSLIIPEGYEKLGDNFLKGATKLTTITLPSTLLTIGDNAFEECTSLSNITIPASVTSIGNNAFLGCYDSSNGGSNYEFRITCQSSSLDANTLNNNIGTSLYFTKEGDGMSGESVITKWQADAGLYSTNCTFIWG